MNDKLNGKPITFDHPEKLTQGVSLEKGDVTAKSFISEVDGEVKSNIVIENKVTGEIAKRDAIIGEIVENENENEDIDLDTNLGLNSGLYPGVGLGMGSSIGFAPGLVSDYGLGSGIGLNSANNKDNKDNKDN